MSKQQVKVARTEYWYSGVEFHEWTSADAVARVSGHVPEIRIIYRPVVDVAADLNRALGIENDPGCFKFNHQEWITGDAWASGDKPYNTFPWPTDGWLWTAVFPVGGAGGFYIHVELIYKPNLLKDLSKLKWEELSPEWSETVKKLCYRFDHSKESKTILLATTSSWKTACDASKRTAELLGVGI